MVSGWMGADRCLSEPAFGCRPVLLDLSMDGSEGAYIFDGLRGGAGFELELYNMGYGHTGWFVGRVEGQQTNEGIEADVGSA